MLPSVVLSCYVELEIPKVSLHQVCEALWYIKKFKADHRMFCLTDIKALAMSKELANVSLFLFGYLYLVPDDDGMLQKCPKAPLNGIVYRCIHFRQR